jgi:AraC family transcriptional regulator of adaptative response/methylated-DNA-[protein]-cysteine methyltransferase
MNRTDDECWTAIAARDRSAEGDFVYSVETTGVYCRPGCPSRLPRRENVRFHVNAAAAERAGFRPCKRCRPDEKSLEARNTAIVTKVCRLIETAEEMPDLDRLAEMAGLSRFHFHRIFKAITGVTPKAYGDAHRTKRVRQELADGASVTDAIYGAGYASSSRFYEGSTERLGMTPSDFRNGAAGLTIRYGFGRCSLGKVLVAATNKGLCAISLGDDADELVAELQKRFPKATLVPGGAGFTTWIDSVVRFVEAPGIGLDLPLDLQGTAFQIRVWQALREIRPGDTISYGDLAARLGMPKGARAVANACAANKLAVAVPCHRVVGSDGNLTGYRWGVSRKRRLLDIESAS